MTMRDYSQKRDEVATAAARPLSHTPLCAVLGLVLGWIPFFVHGPHPWKFTIWRLNGAIAVWGFYTARMLIGLLVGITHWPERWFLRGPLCGFLMLLPLGFIALANPACGYT
jgi:hypothetical protein